MTTTFCQSGAVLVKAGTGVSSEITNVSGANIIIDGDYCVNTWINQAESDIINVCRYDFLANYSSLTSGAKLILEGVASDLAAIDTICYDMGGYTSRVEAEDMINVRRDSALRRLAILRDKKVQSFIVDPTTGSA